MEIYLVRHTTPDIDKGICYGQSDIGLASTWLDEFDILKSKLSIDSNFKVISSPLKRCAFLAETLGKNLSFDNRLKELDFGDWELKSWNDIPEKDITPWMQDFVNVAVPDGESYVQLHKRVHDFVKSIITSKGNQNLCIVSHAGPIRVILSHILNINLKDSFKVKINYGDVFHIRNTNGNLALISEVDL